ncbi:MAG: polymer-forming cytoskeletal protein [Deltaproteobacteria bacterium]|nr:polymer-forming cytoskeletal protein [Deltaproteobacteria bacterium]
MATGTPGIIGSGITIRGNLSGSEALVIEGRVEGQISLQNHLTIEESGRVVADVEVENLTVHGQLEGSIHASETVTIRATARVVGNVRAPRVVIDEGAVFKGGIEMEFDLPEGVEVPRRR